MLNKIVLLLIFVLVVRGQMKAKCDIATSTGTGKISGLVELVQMEGNQVKVTGKISNLEQGKHGFHVHEAGYIGNKCSDAKGHYNPDNTKHGAPTDPRQKRHAGDFGNIEAFGNKEANINITMKETDLKTILNKTIVVHKGEDDLGKGVNADSTKTGNAGPRLGCCVIQQLNGGVKDIQQPNGGVKEVASILMLLSAVVGLLV